MVQSLISDINKKIGKEVIFTADNPKFQIQRIPTGILALDILLGGGVALGRWTELYGEYSVLKTTIALMAIAKAQEMGFACMYCDVGRAISADFMQLRGVNLSPELLLIPEADTGEEYLEIIRMAMKSGLYKIIVIDDISSLLPMREADSKHDTTDVGSQAKLTSKMGRVLTAANDRNTAFILVNQTRSKIGTFMGDTVTRSGGKAPGFYDGQTIRLVRIATERGKPIDGKQKTGSRTLKKMEIAAILEKNKMSGARMGNETVIHYDIENNQVDDIISIITLGQQYGVIERVSQQTYQIVGNKHKYNRSELEILLQRKPKVKDFLVSKIRENAIWV